MTIVGLLGLAEAEDDDVLLVAVVEVGTVVVVMVDRLTSIFKGWSTDFEFDLLVAPILAAAP